jgi:hypothetical protein
MIPALGNACCEIPDNMQGGIAKNPVSMTH